MKKREYKRLSNEEREEMILAVTRLGKGSSIVFTGDFYQSDLRKAKGSIMEFADMIKEVNGVSKFTSTNSDVVRNKILVEITKFWGSTKTI
jgi:phosphate starvation-inducible protein PhoH